MISNKLRLKHIDILKGVGILFVIFFHIFTKNEYWLYYSAAFKMPIFFFISGYLFRMYDFKTFIQHKFKGLIIPYFIFGLINLIICLSVGKVSNIWRYFQQFLWINNEPPIPIAGALWFLTSLFFVNILAWLIYKYKKYCISLIVFAIIITCQYIFKIELPFSIDTAIFMVIFFFAGYGFKKIESSLKVNYFTISLLLTLSFTSVWANGYVNPRITNFNNIFFYYTYAIIGVLTYYYISKSIQNLKITDTLAYIGKNSLYFMCLSQMITYILRYEISITNRFSLFLLTCIINYLIIEIPNNAQRNSIWLKSAHTNAFKGGGAKSASHQLLQHKQKI